MKMFPKLSLLVALSVVAVLTSACMQGEARHTVYIEPGGGLRWVVEERLQRSSENKEADRLEEEREWRELVDQERHNAAAAFDLLGAYEIETRWVHRERPYAVTTTGRFESGEMVVRRLIESSGVVATVQSQADSRGGFLSVDIDVEASEAAESDNDDESLEPIWDLLLAADEFEFAVSAGRFLDAEGFVLDEDGLTATFDEDALSGSERVRLHLVWRHDN